MRPLVLTALALVASAPAQVKIHDPVVSLLAKPYGIEERIQLESIDAIHAAADGAKRLTFTLRNSGVKKVELKRPDFSLDLVMPDGSWASLGSLSGCSIEFPATGDDQSTRRTYVAVLETRLGGGDIEAHLRRAAKSGKQVRLLGRAEMIVSSKGRVEFSKKNLKLEVHGPLKLGPGFGLHTTSGAKQLPEPGRS